MKNITLQNAAFVISLIVYFYNPSAGLILLALSVGWFVLEIAHKRNWITWTLAFISSIGIFLLLEAYSTRRQAKIIVAEVYEHSSHYHETPKDLDEVFLNATMMKTAHMSNFIYERKMLTRHTCEWKLEFSTIWGTHYFYNDRNGEFEETASLDEASDHWNTFWKAESHLKRAGI